MYNISLIRIVIMNPPPYNENLYLKILTKKKGWGMAQVVEH
jgi:hypothetical protein